MKILGIETSCDETAVCVLECSGDFGSDFTATILGNALFSQAHLHAPYGGVFPNLAKREHQKNLVPLLKQALRESGQLVANSEQLGSHSVTGKLSPVNLGTILERETELLPHVEKFLQTYQRPDIDVIAVTFGPGLEPALWPGINFAKALSIVWNIPIVPVNHMEGHIFASLVQCESGQITGYSGQENPKAGNTVTYKLSPVTFPVVALLVSGGHTELQLVRNFGEYQLLGQTRDDAAGEAFDKIARLLDLPYPGGPEISRLAAKARESHTSRIASLPRPMLGSRDFDFSFSGLKTAARKLIEQYKPLSDEMRIEIARETEDAIVETLVTKTLRAAEESGAQTIIVGGGVAANQQLRSEFTKACRIRQGVTLPNSALFPAPGLSTDNAIMIALAGYFQSLKNPPTGGLEIGAKGNVRL